MKNSPGSAKTSAIEFFGFKRHPFIDHPDTGTILSEHEEQIMEISTELIKLGKSFALTGPSGTGKTTFVRKLQQQLDRQSYHPVFISYSGLNRAGLLKTIAAECRLDLGKRTVPPLVRIQKHLLEIARDKNPRFPVLIIDDAQLLEQDSVMDVCSLLADPDQKRAAASLILIGDETLEERIQLNVMTPVRNRMACILSTRPLDADEVSNFMGKHLESAQAPKDLFSAEALNMLAAKTRGNRRELLNAATVLLVEAMTRKERTIGPQQILASNLWKKSG